MKTQRFLGAISLFMIAIMTLGLSACSDDKDEPAPEVNSITSGFFEIEKHGFEISAEAQILDLIIHTNVKANCQVINGSEWISLSVPEQSGKEYLTYHVTVKENTGSDKRQGLIVVTAISIPGIIISKSGISGGNAVIITQAGANPQ